MTASVMTQSRAAFTSAPAANRPAKANRAASSFSVREFFAMLQQSYAAARSIPDVGRISTKDVEKVRAIFDVK